MFPGFITLVNTKSAAERVARRTGWVMDKSVPPPLPSDDARKLSDTVALSAGI